MLWHKIGFPTVGLKLVYGSRPLSIFLPMKFASALSSLCFRLVRLPLSVGTLALCACATQSSVSTSSPAPTPMAADPVPAPAPMATPAPAPAPAVAPVPDATSTPVVAAIDFDQKVQPFFATYCLNCHGSTRQRGKTRFDTKAGILARVTPGDADKSTLLARLNASGDDHMPPENVPDQPTADEIAMIKQWIAQGAKISDGYPSGT